MEIIKNWFRRAFSDPQVVILAVVLVLGLAVIVAAGEMLAPAIAALIIAYLLDSPAEQLRKRGVPHLAAVWIVFLSFVGLTGFALIALVPLLSQQITQLVSQIPSIVSRLQEVLLQLPERYPQLVNEDQVLELMANLRQQLVDVGQLALESSLESLTSAVTVVVYMILVPLMVFFFLKDKRIIQSWITHLLPTDRSLVERVWVEVDHKSGNYVRGKVYEILIVGLVTWAVFTSIGIPFAILLAVLTGFSVLIPYIGAAVVFFPTAAVAFAEWGWGTDFIVACVAYLIIQALDGNLLAPLLFSEVVKLHPNAIIIAILVFGGIWGFWGLFFAIPLASLAQAVLNAWPRKPAVPPPENVQPEAVPPPDESGREAAE